MQTLKERIAICKSMAAEIIATYPGVTNVQFQLDGCDIDQIKELDKDTCIAGDRLRGLVALNDNCTIFADTPPFKSVKPIEYEF